MLCPFFSNLRFIFTVSFPKKTKQKTNIVAIGNNVVFVIFFWKKIASGEKYSIAPVYILKHLHYPKPPWPYENLATQVALHSIKYKLK